MGLTTSTSDPTGTGRAPATAAARAETLAAEVRDDPQARLALCAAIYGGPTGRSYRHLPFRRAALSFMHWQVGRGLLAPADAAVPGSNWWRAVNERLLRDGCEAVSRDDGFAGPSSSATVELWLQFTARPTARSWYRAHNASIVAAYLAESDLAARETVAERFFMNVALLRVLYAHSLVAAPRLSLGRLAPLARPLGDPRLGMAGAFLSLSRILPDRYPVIEDVLSYVNAENNLGRMLDYGVILPRLRHLYEWSAQELEQPALCGLARDGVPSYMLASETEAAWRPPAQRPIISVLQRVTRARPPRPGEMLADEPFAGPIR